MTLVKLNIRLKRAVILKIVNLSIIQLYQHLTNNTLFARLAPCHWFKPSSKIFLQTFPKRYFFVGHLCFFCLVFVMPLCTSVYLCLVVTCRERADLLALVCGV